MKTKLPLIPTIFTIAAIIVLLTFGTWQVQRLVWKKNLVAQIAEKVALAPIELPDNIDIESIKYQRILLEGHFLHDKEIHLFTGPHKMNGESGYNIFTPLETKNGKVVLVDRGWVPAKQKQSANRPETLIEGEVALIGMLHAGEHQGRFTPDNDIEKNLWFWIDIPAIAGFTGKQLDNVYVRALDTDGVENILPVAGKATIELRNDHLQYAIIWYSFAVILLIIYIIYIRGLGFRCQVSGKKTDN